MHGVVGLSRRATSRDSEREAEVTGMKVWPLQIEIDYLRMAPRGYEVLV